MNEGLNAILRMVGSYSILIPFVIGVFTYSRWRRELSQILLYTYVIISGLTEFIAYQLGVNGMNNLQLLHLFTLFEFLILVHVLYYNKQYNLPNRARVILVFGFLSFALINGFFIEGWDRFNANVRAVECLIMIALSLNYFRNIVKRTPSRSLLHSPIFWICTGLLIYFSANLLSFILSNYALIAPEMSHFIWGLHALFNAFKNVFFALALWMLPDQVNSRSS